MMNRYAGIASAILIVFFTLSCRNAITSDMNAQIYDTEAPVIIVSSPSDNSLYSAAVEITGYIYDYSDEAGTRSGRVAAASYAVESTAVSGSISLNDGAFSFSFSTENMSGTITVSITAEDWSGNSSRYLISLLDGEYGITGFSAVAGNREISLNWDEPAGVESYTLYYTDDNSYPNIASGGTNGHIITSACPGMTISSESNGIELTNGKNYIFQLKAEFADGSYVTKPAYSGYVEALPLSPFTLMPAVTSDLENEIELFWSEISSDTGFYLYRSENRYTDYYQISGVLSGNSYTDRNVVSGTRYYYKIVPVTGSEIKSYPASGKAYNVSINRHLASVRESTTTRDILVDGDVLYMTSYYKPLSAWDISDIRKPVEIYGDKSASQVTVVGLQKSGNYLFRPLWDYHIDIFNIDADSTGYLENTGYSFVQKAGDLAISNNYAYSAGYITSGGYFRIDNVTDPSAVTAVQQVDLGSGSNALSSCNRLFYDADKARVYLGSYPFDDPYSSINCPGGFGYIDISDINSPQLTAPVVIGATVGAIEVEDERAYLSLSEYGRGFEVVDTEDLSIHFNYPVTEGAVTSIAVEEDSLYASVNNSGLHEYTIAENPSSAEDIKLKRIFSGPENSGRITVRDNRAYISRALGGFNIVYIGDDFFDLASPVSVDAPAAAENGQDVFVINDYAFLTTESGVRIFDVSDPDSPRWISSYPDTGDDAVSPRGFSVSGNFLFLVDSKTGCHIVDVGDPAAPVLKSIYSPGKIIGTGDYNNRNFGPAVSGDYLYLPEFDDAIAIINIADPEHPVLKAQISPPGSSLQEVLVDHNLLYAADYTSGLKIYDVSDPEQPVETGKYTAGISPVGIDVEGSVCCIANYDGKLTILDISDPGKPELYSTLTIYENANWTNNNTLYDVDIAYGLAVVTACMGGICIADISDPENPVEEALYDPGDQWLSGIMIYDDRAYVASSSGSVLKSLNVFGIKPVE